MYFYYKSVKCSYEATKEIEQELNTSLPGTDSLILRRTVCVNVACDQDHEKWLLLNKPNKLRMKTENFIPVL